LASIILVLAVFSPLTRLTRAAHATGPYVVDTSTDGPDSLLSDGTCSDGVDGCSLRAALQQATYDGVPTTITFGDTLADSTLLVDSTYGTIVWVGDNITVTGESKNIAISGVNLSAGQSIFRIEGSNNLLELLTIKQAPQDGIQIGDFAGVGAGNNNTVINDYVISSTGSGIYLFGGGFGGGQNNTITGSKVGATDLLSTCGSGVTSASLSVQVPMARWSR
jgi:hypothetical protein